MGSLITIATIRISLLLFALALVAWAMRLERGVRWIWTFGFVFFVAHVLSAFHFYHDWSHQAALDDTARKTEQMMGWPFGEGIYFSYLFLVLWGIDALLSWSGQDRRPKWLLSLWLGYLGFIAFNGAAVFEAGPTRWGAWLTVGVLTAIAVGRAANAPRRFSNESIINNQMASHGPNSRAHWMFLVMAFWPSWGFGQELDPRFENGKFTISGLVRFQKSDQAEARRQEFVNAIWTEGLPTSHPKISEFPIDSPELASLDRSLFTTAQLWDVDVSGFDFHSLSFVLFPAARPAGTTKLAIVHAGHMPEGASHYLEAGLARTTEELLRAGSIVALMQMPLAGWNRDADGRIGARPFQVSKRLTAGHDELFSVTEPHLKAGAMRFFLEPVVQVTNELIARAPKDRKLLMIGLSGGGWTTHMSAALDPRIDISIPVAGAFPLYARPFSRGSKGDAEQEYLPLFREADTDGDGILDRAEGTASWLEIFLLGAISPDKDRPRKQIQVLNFHDSCCFHGPIYETYSSALTALAKQFNGSQWDIYIDRSHRSHLISDEVIQQVLARQ